MFGDQKTHIGVIILLFFRRFVGGNILELHRDHALSFQFLFNGHIAVGKRRHLRAVINTEALQQGLRVVVSPATILFISSSIALPSRASTVTFSVSAGAGGRGSSSLRRIFASRRRTRKGYAGSI